MTLPPTYRSLVFAADDLLSALETNDIAKIWFARTSLRNLLDELDLTSTIPLTHLNYKDSDGS